MFLLWHILRLDLLIFPKLLLSGFKSTLVLWYKGYASLIQKTGKLLDLFCFQEQFHCSEIFSSFKVWNTYQWNYMDLEAFWKTFWLNFLKNSYQAIKVFIYWINFGKLWLRITVSRQCIFLWFLKLLSVI